MGKSEVDLLGGGFTRICCGSVPAKRSSGLASQARACAVFEFLSCREFWKIHPGAESPLVAWFRILKLGKFADFNAIKRASGAADYVAPFTIFDIGGNKFRIIAAIHYNRQRLYVRHVFTHLQYDKWTYEMRKQKRKRQKRDKP